MASSGRPGVPSGVQQESNINLNDCSVVQSPLKLRNSRVDSWELSPLLAPRTENLMTPGPSKDLRITETLLLLCSLARERFSLNISLSEPLRSFRWWLNLGCRNRGPTSEKVWRSFDAAGSPPCFWQTSCFRIVLVLCSLQALLTYLALSQQVGFACCIPKIYGSAALHSTCALHFQGLSCPINPSLWSSVLLLAAPFFFLFFASMSTCACSSYWVVSRKSFPVVVF